MYTPSYHREDDPATLVAFARANRFAALVTVGPDGAPRATHLPFVIQAAPHGEPNSAPEVRLIAHLAVANPQWQDFASGREALVIFSGPHAYISPTRYERPLSVPTWNYVAVHAYGVAVVLDDPVRKRRALDLLISQEEPEFAAQLAGYPDAVVEGKLKGIVAFEMRVDRFEARYKLSQDRTEGERRAIIGTLATSAYGPDRDTAAIMQAREPR
jgi:transcriptional regulator